MVAKITKAGGLKAQTSCTQCPLRRLPVFRKFTAKELKFIERFKTAELTATIGTTVLVEGHNSPHLFSVLSGWAIRYKALPDDRRQIVGFSLPGDFLGLQGPVFQEMQHSVDALTPLTLCVFSRAKLWELFNEHPELAYDVAWLTARSESMVDEHLLAVGRRSATERIAYLLLHLFYRCKTLQMTEGLKFTLPASQQDIADALGLSLVHTNKTLRRLHHAQLLRWTPETVELLDEKKLRKIAHFEDEDARQRPII